MCENARDPCRIVSQQVCICFSQLEAWAAEFSYGQRQTESSSASFVRNSVSGYSLSGPMKATCIAGLSALDLYSLVLSTVMFPERRKGLRVLFTPFYDHLEILHLLAPFKFAFSVYVEFVCLCKMIKTRYYKVYSEINFSLKINL